MHPSTVSRKVNALVSIICAFALAFSLGVPYLAFAADEEEASPLEMEVNDVSVDATLSSDIESLDTNVADDATIEEDTEPTSESSEDGTTEEESAANEEENAAPEDSGVIAAADTYTYTFVGAEGGTVTRDVAAGATIASDQIPTGAAGAFTAYGQNIPGTFVGWSTERFSTSSGFLDASFCTNTYNTDWDNSFTSPNGTANRDKTFYPVYKLNAYAVSIGASYDDGGDANFYMFATAGTVISRDNALVQFMQNQGMGQQMKGWFYGGTNDYVRNTPVNFPVTVNSDLAYFNDKGLICVFEYPTDNTDDSGFTSIRVNGDDRVKVSGDLNGPNIPDGATVEVDATPVTSGAAFDDLDKAMGRNRIGDAFEITLLVNGQEVHDGFGTLSISLPIDAAYNGHTIIVYHRHQDGSITTTRAMAKDGCVTFSVTDLSWFAMEDGGIPAGRGGLAQTGDEVPMLLLIGIISVAGGVACFSLLNARSRRKGLHAR